MQSFWVSVTYDTDIVLNSCFTATSRDEAVSCMLNYLQLEFDLPKETNVSVNHH